MAKNILWLSHLLPYPLKAGVIQRSYHLIRELAKEHSVDVLAFRQDGLMGPLVPDLEEGVRAAVEHLSTFCSVLEVLPIPCEHTWGGRYRLAMRSLFDSDGYTLNWLKSESFRRSLQAVLARKHYDVVHLDTISFVPYLDCVGAIPVVLDHHNVESHMMRRRAAMERSAFKKLYFSLEAERLERVERQVCASVRLNLMCSTLDAERLHGLVPRAATAVMPNSVDTSAIRPVESAPANTRLLFFGTMNWYPNIQAAEFLVRELAPALAKNYPHIHIDIVGANPPTSLLSAGAACSNVTVHGFVDDIEALAQQAFAFVCPIIDGGGTKLKVLEAMALGLPIIANQVACEGIDLVHGESVIFAESVQGYLTAVHDLLHTSALGESLGRNARSLVVSTYDTAVLGRKLRELYSSVAEQTQPTAFCPSACA